MKDYNGNGHANGHGNGLAEAETAEELFNFDFSRLSIDSNDWAPCCAEDYVGTRSLSCVGRNNHSKFYYMSAVGMADGVLLGVMRHRAIRDAVNNIHDASRYYEQLSLPYFGEHGERCVDPLQICPFCRQTSYGVPLWSLPASDEDRALRELMRDVEYAKDTRCPKLIARFEDMYAKARPNRFRYRNCGCIKDRHDVFIYWLNQFNVYRSGVSDEQCQMAHLVSRAWRDPHARHDKAVSESEVQMFQMLAATPKIERTFNDSRRRSKSEAKGVPVMAQHSL